MDQVTFDGTKGHLDRIESMVEETLDSESFGPIAEALKRISHALGSRYSVDLTISLEVFDREKKKTLPLMTVGYASSDDGEPYRTREDCSFHRYALRGEIQVVPHDRCPNCWGEWDFKFKHRTCPECGVTLGSEVKVLLDTDVCPNCEEGHVSMENPICPKCGFEIDPKTVVWG